MNEEQFITNIQCDVEINVQGADTGSAATRLAALLRTLADRVESGDFEDGHHNLMTLEHRPAGTVYFDVSEGNGFADPDAPLN